MRILNRSCVQGGACILLVLGALSACADLAKVPAISTYGPNPTLVEPRPEKIPTVDIAPAKGWPDGVTPTPARGLTVKAFATNLDHPRWLHVLPNGDVLVAATNAPKRPEEEKGLKAKAMGLMMKKAGAATPSANRIILLRDADGDGIVDTRTVLVNDLNSPFGMALVGDTLFIANTDAVVRVPYREGDTEITATPQKVVDLPAGPRNHHWTKSLVASRDGKLLYVGVGSNSDHAENGMNEEWNRAAILEIDPASGRTRVFASGLRNPVGLAWHPKSGALWTAVNERDQLGSDLVPDYMTAVQDGGFYGWPYSYFGQNLDERVKPQNPEMVAKALVPDYALGAHTAPLGLAFYEGQLFPARYAGGAFIGQHGSWNRKPPAGYKVIFVPFGADGQPSDDPEDVLTGFLNAKGEAHGRPVGVAVDRRGALLVADDVGNAIWRVTPIGATRRDTTASR